MRSKETPVQLKVVFNALIFILAVGVWSCSSSDGTVSTNDSTSYDAIYTSTLPDADDSPSDVPQPTEVKVTDHLWMHAPESDKRCINDFGLHLGKLHLMKDQKEMIRVFHHQHIDCYQGVRDSLRRSEAPIFAVFSVRIDAVRAQLNAGLITMDAAAHEVAIIVTEFRVALITNPVRTWAKLEFASCREMFYLEVRAILTFDQQSTWDKWWTKHRGNK
jgi:hypothetical protein